MRLQLTQQEVAALTLHMAIMRKKIKQTAKRQNTLSVAMASYDYIQDSNKKLLNERCDGHIDLNIYDCKLLNDFLVSYNKLIDNIEITNDIDKQQLRCLRNIQCKTHELLMQNA